MQFLVKMRDGSSFTVDAAYIEVIGSPASSYTFLGPVPGYSRAILATFPAELVVAVLPSDQGSWYVPPRVAEGPARDGNRPEKRPDRAPLPPIAAADV